MLTLDQIHESLNRLNEPSPWAFGLAAMAGLLLALTPTVLAMVPAVMGYVAGEVGITRRTAATRSLAFVLGTATTFGAYGLIFGYAGAQLAPLFGQNGYLIAGIVMVALGLIMLVKFRLRAPAVVALERRVSTTAGAYFLGLPFGFVGSACPCSIPVVLALLLYAGSTGSPWFGAALLFVFALMRGLPLVLAGTFTGMFKDFKALSRWQPNLEKGSGALLIVLGTAFVFQRFGMVAAAVAAGIAAVSVMVWLLATGLRARSDHFAGPKEEGIPLLEVEIRTPGMVCEGCAGTLSQSLLRLQAVHKVLPDVKQKRVRVFYNPQRLTEDQLRQHVEKMGFS